MDPSVREAAIETITAFACHHDADTILEICGFNTARTDVTDGMVTAAIGAVLPLLPDERIHMMMHHIAEVLLYQSDDETEGTEPEVAA